MNARELITRAYYLSGVVARELETVSGPQISDGLMLLNGLLSEKSGTGKYLPYYTHTQIPSETGEQLYEVDNLVILDELTFNIGPVRYEMKRDTRYRFWGTAKIDNIEALPFHYYSERVLNKMKIYVYFKPENEVDYFTATGRYALTNVSLDDDMSDMLDGFYLLYLQFLLAEYICLWNSLTFAPEKKARLAELDSKCVDVNQIDFTVRKISTFQKRPAMSYAQVNIGHGWTKP